MAIRLINPAEIARPSGFSHGAVGRGLMLFIAGQIGADKEGKIVSDDLVDQFDWALGNVVRVIQEAGGKPEDIIKINLLVLDKDEYRDRTRDIGVAYRKHLGRYFPAMTFAAVKGLYNEKAKVEIEAVALLSQEG